MKTPAPDPISAGAPAAAGMVRAMRGLVARDLRLALRRRADPLSVLVFFVLAYCQKKPPVPHRPVTRASPKIRTPSCFRRNDRHAGVT